MIERRKKTKMQTKEIKVYEFKELNKDIQEKVLNDFRGKNEYSFLEENLKESLEEELKKNKIKVLNESLKQNYSLSCCQGDGYSFTGLFKWKRYIIKIDRENCHYYHKRSTDIFLETEKGNEVKEEKWEEFKNLYYDICDKLEKIGYAEIEAEDNDENIKETIKINEYTFRENGEIEHL